MNKGMVICPECYKWYFNKHKLNKHLIEEHDYAIIIEEEVTSDATK